MVGEASGSTTTDESGAFAMPGLGTAFWGAARLHDTEMFYAFTSFLYPTTIFRHDFTSGTSTVFKAPEIAFDSAPNPLTVADKKEPIYEAGFANLTKPETTMLVHFGKARSQQWTLARIEQPAENK